MSNYRHHMAMTAPLHGRANAGRQKPLSLVLALADRRHPLSYLKRKRDVHRSYERWLAGIRNTAFGCLLYLHIGARLCISTARV